MAFLLEKKPINLGYEMGLAFIRTLAYMSHGKISVGRLLKVKIMPCHENSCVCHVAEQATHLV